MSEICSAVLQILGALRIAWFFVVFLVGCWQRVHFFAQTVLFLCWALIFWTFFIALQQVAPEWIILLLFEISITWNFCLTNCWEVQILLSCSVSVHGCGVSQSVIAVCLSKDSGNSFLLIYIYLYRENNKYLSCK